MRGWTAHELCVLSRCRGVDEARAALPHRRPEDVHRAAVRMRMPWALRRQTGPRGPHTRDERRFAILLAAVAHGGVLQVEDLLDLCRSTNWRAVADQVRPS